MIGFIGHFFPGVFSREKIRSVLLLVSKKCKALIYDAPMYFVIKDKVYVCFYVFLCYYYKRIYKKVLKILLLILIIGLKIKYIKYNIKYLDTRLFMILIFDFWEDFEGEDLERTNVSIYYFITWSVIMILLEHIILTQLCFHYFIELKISPFFHTI